MDGKLFARRSKGATGWVDAYVVAIYCAVLLWVIPRHEAWADEAQAWLLAEKARPEALFGHLLRYEGTPGLWHVLLLALVRLHVSYMGMHWIAGLIGLAGVLVLLRWAPFSTPIKVLLPFTFFLQYQYAVVARSYVLFPVLAFGLCAVARSRRPRPVLFAVLAGLMANVSLHGSLFSLGMAWVYWTLGRERGWWGSRSKAGKLTAQPHWRSAAVTAAVALLAFWMAVPATAWLPPDHSSVGGVLNRPFMQRILMHRAGLPVRTDPAWFVAMQRADRLAEARKQEMADSRLRNAVLNRSGGELDGLVPAEPPDRMARENPNGKRLQGDGAQDDWEPPPQPWWDDLLDELVQFGSLMTFPISNWNALALPFLLLLVAWVWLRHRMTMLLPWLLIFVLCMMVRVGEYHTGMLWISLVCALWLTWPEERDPVKMEQTVGGRTFRALEIAMCMVLVVQVGWTASAVWGDVHQPYSPEKALATFLRPYVGKVPIAGLHYQTIGANAYFGRSIYSNQPTAYWEWPIRLEPDRRAPEALAKHPRFVVVALYGPGSDALNDQWLQTTHPGLYDRWNMMELAERYGYRETHRFCGGLRMRFGVSENQCEVVMEPMEMEASVAGKQPPR